MRFFEKLVVAYVFWATLYINQELSAKTAKNTKEL